MDLEKIKEELSVEKELLKTLDDREDILGCMGRISAKEELLLVFGEE